MHLRPAQTERPSTRPSRVSGDAEHEAVRCELEAQRRLLEVQNQALREAQQALAQSLKRYSDLSDHLPIGYLLLSPQGFVECANPAARELLRTEAESLAGSSFRRFLDGYDAGRFAAHLEACVKTGRASTIEFTLRLPDKATAMVQASSRLVPASAGEDPRVSVALTDVTKLKRMMRTLEEVNREQEAFNHSISHDLRAPLVTISNYARIVLGDHGQQLDEEGRGMMQRIENAAVRMEETLRHLLEYSTLAREEVLFEHVDVRELVRDLLIEHRGVIQQSAADIQVAPDLPRVLGSKVILGQVLANLLTNALKYTSPGVPPRVEIGAAVREGLVCLWVRDHGIGIDPKYHERVFQIFERLHGYSRYPGSGVGLAIARRAVERMNGRIWVESELGRGSCFFLELPAP